jgi:hypothetical protein
MIILKYGSFTIGVVRVIGAPGLLRRRFHAEYEGTPRSPQIV